MSGAVEREAELRAELITYAVRYGGMCRDCADMVDGVCEHKGTPCDTKVFRAAIAHALAAWDYGGKHGFCTEIGPLANLRSDNERLGRERDEAVESVNNLIGELNASGNKLVDENNRRMNSEAERATLLAQVEKMRGAIDGIYIYANDTLSGRADGGPDDRAWQRAAVVEIRNRARVFATVQSAVDARAALTKEPSAGRSLLKENPNG